LAAAVKNRDLTAYLVIRRGGRWTDVLRLQPDRKVIIGRSSQSQIVIRSDQCSRAHAELAAVDDAWVIRDLGSRNGTVVNGEPLAGPHTLREDDVIVVAGCQMTFVHQVADALANPSATAGPQQSPESAATEQQIDPTLITERRSRSELLEADAYGSSEETELALFRVAFELARSESPEQAAELALSALNRVTGTASGGVLIWRTGKPPAAKEPRGVTAGINALATSHRPERSYRQLSERLAAAVVESDEAVLARNIRDDLALATPDSQGELSMTSALCAPIRVGQRMVGLLHVYSCEDEAELQPQHLEYALAIAANLALALEHQWRERQLTKNLRRSEQRLAELRKQLGDRVQIVGHSPAILEIERQVARAAPTSATVLVRGESGVGKELVAAAIHYASPRREGPFVCLNCAALSPSLLESELFGHEKGAFTGATERKIGKFEAADGGTLMLDEIGEMSPEIQAKFLRVLEGQPFERLGGNAAIRVDVRVVAATNRDLEAAVREGTFRSDLYFRLHVLELRVPPLRERGDDIVLLAEHFTQRYCQEIGRRLEGLSEAARDKLTAYRWPGNIRELKNAIERAVVLCPGPRIDADDLLLSDLQLPGQPASTQDAAGDAQTASDSDRHAPFCDAAGAPLPLAVLESEHIDRVLEHTGGNKSQAARLLGIERSTLDRKLKRLRG
jgi:Nif-specific regulatory protein